MRIIVIAAATFILGFALGRISSPNTESTPINTQNDTLYIRQPELMVVHPKPSLKARLPLVVHDTIVSTDTVTVEVPMSQNVYESPRYRAYVSGFQPSLDSLIIAPDPKIQAPKSSPFSVGVSAGVGITPVGVQPYIGVGISFKLL